MDPVMVQIGPLAIRWYGVLLTLAIFLGYELARRRLRAWGWDLEPFERVVFWAVVFGVVGARLGYVLTSPGYFLENPLGALYIWHGGLSFHGAILGGASPSTTSTGGGATPCGLTWTPPPRGWPWGSSPGGSATS